jgi:microcystin degradation protein MlrC
MLSQATVLVGFKEYPHIDAIDRILEVFELVTHTAEGKIRPAMAPFECRMIEAFPTTSEP